MNRVVLISCLHGLSWSTSSLPNNSESKPAHQARGRAMCSLSSAALPTEVSQSLSASPTSTSVYEYE